MFQLGNILLLCALLTGTSESLLEDLGSDLNKVLHDGLETVDNTLDTVLGKVKDDLTILQESNIWAQAKQKILEAEKLINNALSHLFPTNGLAAGLKISNVHILDFKAELSPDGNGLNLRFPVTANVTASLPLIGQAVNLKASLDLLAGVRIETNPKTGLSRVVLGECASDPNSISLSLLGGHSPLVNKLVNTVTNFLSETVSFLVQKQMCPLIRMFLSTLDVDFIQNIIARIRTTNLFLKRLNKEDRCDALTRLIPSGLTAFFC